MTVPVQPEIDGMKNRETLPSRRAEDLSSVGMSLILDRPAAEPHQIILMARTTTIRRYKISSNKLCANCIFNIPT